MRDALVGLVERMCPDEAVHLQWGVGLSHVARGLDIMTLTRGGLIESLNHPWHRNDMRDATGNDVPSLTAPPELGLEPEPAAQPHETVPKSTSKANWQPARRRRSLAPFIAAGLAVVIIIAVLLLSQSGGTTMDSTGRPQDGSSAETASGGGEGAGASTQPSTTTDPGGTAGLPRPNLKTRMGLRGLVVRPMNSVNRAPAAMATAKLRPRGIRSRGVPLKRIRLTGK